VVAARRTPFAPAGRGLAAVGVSELAAPVLRALAADLGGPRIDDVLLGNARGPGGDIARVAALAAGLGEHVPGVTVDRQCGSGLEAIRLGAALVGSGAARVVLAGGVESVSRAEPGRSRFAPAGFADPGMGEAAEQLAAAAGITRARQDAYAARSQRLALAAARAGRLDAELVPLAGLTRDERPRHEPDPDTLARFRPAFVEDGTVTAGNSCFDADGAAAVAIVTERERAARGRPGLAVLATAASGVDPAAPGLGPVPAVREVLRRSGITLDEVGLLELNEAFAAQLLACADALGVDPFGNPLDRKGPAVCPDGGAIARGHPWAASGAALMVRLFARLVPDGGPRYGLAACPVGGGQGVAVLVERVGIDRNGIDRTGIDRILG
jgi:acetyl-CoA C-acetyltransferase